MPVSEEEQINKSTNPSPKYINVSQNWVSGIYNRKTNKFHNPVIDAGKHMPEHMNDLHALKEAGHIKGWTEHESPQKTWGEETYQVGPEGRLKFVTAHYDTSD
jgi:hypothetical protein